MSSATNTLPCIEIRNHRQVVTAGRLVVTYEQRQPGAVDWQPVRFERAARPEDAPTPNTRTA